MKRLPFVLLALCGALSACQSTQPESRISGIAFEKTPLANAKITLIDARGTQLHTITNMQGEYEFSRTALQAPLLVSVVSGGDAKYCSQNAQLRPVCLAAVIEKLAPTQIANINPLTDRIASDVAVAQGFIGPQQWVDSAKINALDPAVIAQARSNMQQGFTQALALAGVNKTADFDPATYPIHRNAQLVEMLSLLNHNRNYDNNSGQTGHTTLSDVGFRPLVGLMNSGAYEPFDFVRARAEQQAIRNAAIRIFVVGDSTSAVYEQLRFPRMGWAQMLEREFKTEANVKVIVGSRAGRSSRDFYNGRWFAQMEQLIQPGDYVFINQGHNDQSCDSARPERGIADVQNLCTYPNNAAGKIQHPAGKPELSFYHSLQRYVNITRERGAIPVLFTPTARIKNAKGEQTTPVVHSHVTQHKPGSNYAFVGDYRQTIMDLARTEQLPLIDLGTASIRFANQVGDPGWKSYWLVVDKRVNPYYTETMGGSPQLPDGTHFQKNGAEVMTKLSVELINSNPALKALAEKLKAQ
ncbi:GDSL-type esterase/lipase family protein [Cellvibrio sp. KY-YJ-3]|uniref:GDSL-type esterase/lipase family protein n=1 Tax=Cellvibrio sp. KY-YJ-3 TaxID=454662 RepID=UPI001CD9DD4B|nr:GDSL-type esterase/lipase family protein [Cellvibrio sp. KY-YJ-3]